MIRRYTTTPRKNGLIETLCEELVSCVHIGWQDNGKIRVNHYTKWDIVSASLEHGRVDMPPKALAKYKGQTPRRNHVIVCEY